MRRGKISVCLSNDKVVLSYGRGVTLADIERFLRSEKVLKWISKTTDRSNGVMRGGNAVIYWVKGIGIWFPQAFRSVVLRTETYCYRQKACIRTAKAEPNSPRNTPQMSDVCL